MTGDVETLMTWDGAGGTAQMFAAVGLEVYGVSNVGAVGAAEFGSLTNNRWQWVNFNNTVGTTYLVACNGDDAVRNDDGTTWTTPTITGTGLTSTDFINVNVFKNRLLFIEKDSMSFWYLATGAIAGTAIEFDLGGVAELGGELVASETWTLDGGTGMDDVAVFLTSRGEAIVYQGTNPNDFNNWALVGRFRVGAPMGRRCTAKVGSDALVITEDGFLSFSGSFPSARSAPGGAISDKISRAVNDAVRDHRDDFGWQITLYPNGEMLIFNVPQIENQTYHQYVMNTNTKSWCRFTGWDANCMVVFGSKLYYGGQGTVFLADSGQDDENLEIDGDVLQAFTNFGSTELKTFTMARPIFETDGIINPVVDVNVDYVVKHNTNTPTFSSLGSLWDVSTWDVASWSGTGILQRKWKGVSSIGYAGAVHMSVKSNGVSLDWHATQYVFEAGTII
jgi:hypothetical protein